MQWFHILIFNFYLLPSILPILKTDHKVILDGYAAKLPFPSVKGCYNIFRRKILVFELFIVAL